MSKIVSSKNIDGITDLVVVAPIKEGFIEAYENVTYATRLRVVAEALNRVRVAAREHEKIMPFEDVTQRILTLLDFRVGVIDKDLFALPEMRDARKAWRLQSRRYLYLTATFDGAWEPYMRLIWDPMGPFLDLLFCNCEGYVTATEHDCDEFLQWVRDNQMDSAIFYATTGLTVRDHMYLDKLERLQRAKPPASSESEIARLTMPQPKAAAQAERTKALKDLAKSPPDRAQYASIHELALEALTVLYRLADYYPPQWLVYPPNGVPPPTPLANPAQPRKKPAKPPMSEGHYLLRAATDVLRGWEELIPTEPGPRKDDWEQRVVPIYKEPLHWYETGKKHLGKLDEKRKKSRPKDPVFEPSEIQGGMLKPQGSAATPVKHGALMLMTITDAEAARRFIEDDLHVHYADGEGSVPAKGFFRTIGFTAVGLRRIGLEPCLIDHFPQEFREGMEMRAGLLGDMRENHPREWKLPRRNWPRDGGGPLADARPPVELSEVDFVIQVRSTNDDPAALIDEIERLAELAAPGASLQSYQLMQSLYSAGISCDHFGFRDGISQPEPIPGIDDSYQRKPEEVRLGELLLGYRNDRDDYRPRTFRSFPEWRRRRRLESLHYQADGSFLVVRKLTQHVDDFAAFIASETKCINKKHPALPSPMTEERLKAKLIGRFPDGTPLISKSVGLNGFTYDGDTEGKECPFAAHIRRANPRNSVHGRSAPRIVRRGMSFDDDEDGKGLVFMAYNASIAEQYETIQRWINGGNSTGVAATHNDPVFGVAPRTGELEKADHVFRFIEGNEVIRVTMPKPFTTLHWGLYLFVPSRTALRELCALTVGYRPLDEALEMTGRAVLDRMKKISDKDTVGQEWKRLLEDFDAKDPSERNISPDVWAALRYYCAGIIQIDGGVPLHKSWEKAPPDDQPMTIVASRTLVAKILRQWKDYTTEEQLRRIEHNSGPIFVTQQPDGDYKSNLLKGKYKDYYAESKPTNAILMGQDQHGGFEAGYEAGRALLERFREAAIKGGRSYYKLELRRQFLLPALEGLCKHWYGLPDGVHMQSGGWSWDPPEKRKPAGPRCPGDFLSPSRNAFYPRPSETVAQFADLHGEAILKACGDFVAYHREHGNGAQTGTIAQAMFAAIKNSPKNNIVLARNLIGTMIGAIPPMDGNLRGILLEWLTEKTLWRHQSALRRALGDQLASTDVPTACRMLYGPVSQAMCKRPSPDLLYRTAKHDTKLPVGRKKIDIGERDLVVVSLVSASHRSLQTSADGDVSVVFGGNRLPPGATREPGASYPVHACPAQKLAMGAIMGILAALLDAGRIQALPAALIVRISDWSTPSPPPAA
jgi:deferrochelatase/peroxidase EfeB